MKFFVLFLFVEQILGLSYIRQFSKKVIFDDSSRWQNGEFPCSGDTIEFPYNKPISVFVDSNLAITDLFLPLDGELIFADDVIWGTSSDLSSCHGNGKTSIFKSEVDDWFDAGNWETFDLQIGTKLNRQNFLDSENVPCDYDQVEFHEDQTWMTSINLNVTLNRLTVSGQRFDSNSFSSFRQSPEGRFKFQGSGDILINPQTCPDPTGCFCRSANNHEISQYICTKTNCPSQPSCNGPLRPIGQCCSVCGSVLTMSYTSTYTEVKMTQFLASQVTMFPKTYFALSKQRYSDKDLIQIMLTDESTGDDAKRFAEFLRDKFQDSANDNLGVVNITMTSSGPATTSSSGLSSGAIVGIVVGILSLILIFGFLGIVKKRGVQMNLPSISWKKTPPGEDNPLYDPPSFDQTEMKKTSKLSHQTMKDTGLPQALQSDFGISFPNINYEEEDL